MCGRYSILGGGSITDLSSNFSMFKVGGMAGYLTKFKAAIVGLTRALARDLGGDNIRVNSILRLGHHRQTKRLMAYRKQKNF